MSSSAAFISPYNLGNLLAPVDGTTHGAKCAVNLAGNVAQLSIASLQQVMGNFNPQSILVDNSENVFDLIVTELVFGFKLVFPAGTINWINFPSVQNSIFNFSSAGSVDAQVSFFDFPALPFSIGNSQNQASSSVTIAGQPIDVNVVSNTAATIAVQPVNDSIVSVADASTLLLAANVTRKYLIIQAPETAALWINMFGGAAAPNASGCIYLGAGDIYESAYAVNANALYYYCATADLEIVVGSA